MTCVFALFVEAHVDISALLAQLRLMAPPAASQAIGDTRLKPPAQRIAVARDDAFSFFYPHLASAWRSAGAEILFFSPLADAAPPDNCDLCWLPGGYPELYAGELAQAGQFLNGLRRFAQTRPVHGECGGYMGLGETLEDAQGTIHPMAGRLGVRTSFARRAPPGHRPHRSIRSCSSSPRGGNCRTTGACARHSSTRLPRCQHGCSARWPST